MSNISLHIQFSRTYLTRCLLSFSSAKRKMALAQSILSCSLVVFKYLIRVAGNFNPGYFNPKLFQSRLLKHKHFPPLHSKSQGLKLGYPHPKGCNCGLFNLSSWLKNLWLKTWWLLVQVKMFWSKGPDSEYFDIGLCNTGLFNTKFMVEKLKSRGLNS